LLTVTGTVAKTNSNDASSASGALTVSGTVAYSNANDTASGAALVTVSGAASVTNADDSGIGSGELRAAIGAPGRKPVYTVKVNGQLITGSYQDIQALIQSLAEQDAKEAATQAIEQAKAPRRAKFLRVMPVKPVEAAQEQITEPIVAKPLVFEYEQAYQTFLQTLLSNAIAQKAMRDDDDETALMLLL
jgi:hypothetical protein